mgnify:CR=1 FL=1
MNHGEHGTTYASRGRRNGAAPPAGTAHIRIVDIPGVIVHGRYDVVCPVQNAFDLHQVWPKAELVVTPASGHSAFEAENVDALVRATDRFA